jgi:hypothetical protein
MFLHNVLYTPQLADRSLYDSRLLINCHASRFKFRFKLRFDLGQDYSHMLILANSTGPVAKVNLSIVNTLPLLHVRVAPSDRGRYEGRRAFSSFLSEDGKSVKSEPLAAHQP